jgi:AcrR family transcriptional regulator
MATAGRPALSGRSDRRGGHTQHGARAALIERSLRPEQGLHGSKVAEMQRSRLLAAAAAAVDERGYADTAVADVTKRARVSRRTFYEQFANREDCLVAVLEDVMDTLAQEVAAAAETDRPWLERLRLGLAAVLVFFDREPVLARVCIVQVPRGGPELLEYRERILARLIAVVDGGRLATVRGVAPTPLTAEGVVGAAFAIVHARLLRRDGRPLLELLNELMGMIVLPYRGVAAARRELTRSAPSARGSASQRPSAAARMAADPLEGVQMRLTYRTARVLEALAEYVGASNREVAERAGVHDPGQISKLLARLEKLGLITNGNGRGKGEPNAWQLTPLGQRVSHQLCLNPDSTPSAA